MYCLTKTVAAHAKVNIMLSVLQRRSDGYHEVAMLMQQISLHDQVTLQLSDSPGIRVNCPGIDLAEGEENIAGRAAQKLLEYVGLNCGVKIDIEKRIPAAAGLGGGSSDAAAVLHGLNDLLQLSLSKAELMSLGGQLGADVPFFLFGQTAWATGIGERLQSWPGTPPFWLVLVNPGFAVSTAWVYQNLGLTHPKPIAKIPKFPAGVQGLVCLLHNDLEAVTSKHYPIVHQIKQSLTDAGALGSLMSGSGPTVFGVFDDLHRAESAASTLSRTHGWWTQVATPH